MLVKEILGEGPGDCGALRTTHLPMWAKYRLQQDRVHTVEAVKHTRTHRAQKSSPQRETFV